MCQCGQQKRKLHFCNSTEHEHEKYEGRGGKWQKNCFGYCLHIVVIIKIYINFWLLLDVNGNEGNKYF